jgi:uncharacterized protein YecT (DUF1311 family)
MLMLSILVSQAQAASIRDVDIADVLSKDEPYSDCGNEGQKAVYSVSTDYYDFDGDGVDEAIFVGASCYSGTGGPDIHSVYKLEASGGLVELPLQEPKGPLPLAGNRNYTLYEKNGLLVMEFHDSSGREKPLTIYYRWNGSRFEFIRMKMAPFFNAGFDCKKARTEVEITVCGSKKLSALDKEMNDLYRSLLQSLPSERSDKLIQEQKKWLSRRNNECNYKWIRDCLLDSYKARLDVLKGWQ